MSCGKQHVSAEQFKAGIEYRGQEYEAEYWGAFNEEDELIAVLAHCWNGSLLLQAPALDALKLLVTTLRQATQRLLTGILGPAEQAEIVMQELGLRGDCYAYTSLDELYEIDLATWTLESPLVDAAMIPVQDVDSTLLNQWIRAYEIEGLGAVEDENLPHRVAGHIESLLRRKVCWVLQVGGQPVALSGFNACLPDRVQVGPVWTPPEHRGKKYARTLVALTLQYAKEHGIQKVSLFTHNPVAAHVYQALGFKLLGTYRIARLKVPVTLS